MTYLQVVWHDRTLRTTGVMMVLAYHAATSDAQPTFRGLPKTQPLSLRTWYLSDACLNSLSDSLKIFCPPSACVLLLPDQAADMYATVRFCLYHMLHLLVPEKMICLAVSKSHS
jgi:hypothetical protein